MKEWVVFLHVASVLAFMLAHGVHISAMWAMRAEPDPERMLTFFNIVPTVRSLRALLGAVIATGVAAGFLAESWDQLWIWASLLLLAGISVVMWLFGGTYYGLMQQAAEAAVAARSAEPPDPAPQAAYDAVRGSWHTVGVSAVGVAGLALILWLMMFKPF
ncbi:MAG: hypothetical protein WED12_06345 [Chloroflexota bacterium]